MNPFIIVYLAESKYNVVRTLGKPEKTWNFGVYIHIETNRLEHVFIKIRKVAVKQ